MNIVLIITTLLGHFGYIFLIDKKKMKEALLSKTIAAISFVLIGIINLSIPPEEFKIWFVYALIFDALGDIFLGLRNIFPNHHMFEIGTFSFLFGHFLFLRGILPEVNTFLCAGIVLVLIILYKLFYFKKLKSDTLHIIIGLIYVFSILLIMVSSIDYWILIRSKTSLLRMIGTILFACSDLILIDYNYRKKAKYVHGFYSLLYFVAQIFIGLSLG